VEFLLIGLNMVKEKRSLKMKTHIKVNIKTVDLMDLVLTSGKARVNKPYMKGISKMV
jgi:hypothetical protein